MKTAIGHKVYRIKTTDDSFAWAQEYANEAPDGSVFLADQLTKARGRQGRTWEIYDGQLTVTILLKPQNLSSLSPEDLPVRLNQLTMALSLGIITPLIQHGAWLKWPNDIMIGTKKMGGLLSRLIWQGQKPSAIVVGFSLNINNIFQENSQLFSIATSLRQEMGAPFEIRPLYFDILGSLNHWYSLWHTEKFMDIYKSWKQLQGYLGKEISIHQKDGSVLTGTAQQVLPNGDLMLSDKNKKMQHVSFYMVEEIKLAI